MKDIRLGPILECFECGGGPVENQTTGLCATCSAARRKAERHASKVKVAAPVKKITAKRAGKEREYAKLRREYLSLYPACEVPECNEKATEIHHRKGRAGDLLTDTNYFMAVCHHHHHKITVDSAWAVGHGFSEIRSS